MAGANRSSIGRRMAAMTLAVATTPALAQKQYGPGVTDTEIKIGTTTPYSGPASAYSAGAISATAYFTMINEQGGVNGRKINYISLDDAYSPPKTVEQIRAPDRERRSAVPGQSRSAPRPTWPCSNTSTRKTCRISSSAPVRRSSTIPSIIRGR